MEEINRNGKAILSQLDTLCAKTTNIEELVNKFLGSEIMQTTKEDILSEKTSYKKNDAFYNHMTKKITNAVIQKLLKALNDTGNIVVAGILTSVTNIEPILDSGSGETPGNDSANGESKSTKTSNVNYHISGNFINDGTINHS